MIHKPRPRILIAALPATLSVLLAVSALAALAVAATPVKGGKYNAR